MNHLKPELIVALLAMLPVFELRAAIPVGLLLKMSIESTFFWAELGNIIPVLLLLKILRPISEFLIKYSKFFERFFDKLFNNTRKKNKEKFQKYGAVFLIIVTAIPLPGTGAWTGALIAFLFDIPYWRAVSVIFVGNIIAGILIFLGFGTALEAFNFIHSLK